MLDDVTPSREGASRPDGRLPRVLRKRGRRRRSSRVSNLAVLPLVVALCIPAGGGALLVKSQVDSLQTRVVAQVEAGQTELEAAKTSLKLANASRDLTQVAAAQQHFSRAKVDFAAARRLADGSLLLRGSELVPLAGAYVSSRRGAVDGIAAMGVALCDAGQQLADLDAQLLKPAKTGGQQGQAMLAVLHQLQDAMPAILAALQRADAAAGSVDVALVPAHSKATFVKARETIQSGINTMRDLQQLIPVLIDMLGGNGSRTYLIEQVNPAELRPGGGFIGSYSVLKSDNGTLTIAQSGNSYELITGRPAAGQKGYIPPPGPLHEFVPTVSWSFVDSNFFPDFPSNAKAAEQFAVPALKTPIDAVISMDYYTVAAILRVTGPIQVPGYAITLSADNLVSLLIQFDLQQGYTHKAILGAVAAPMFQRVLALSPSEWPAMISALADVVSHRDFQVYFNNQSAQDAMTRFGWTGAINPTHAVDYLMEVESNLGGTKANYFVARSYSVHLERRGPILHHTVTVTVTDNMPTTYAPGDYYHAYTALYTSDQSTAGTDDLTPPKYPNIPPPAGLHRLDGWMKAIPGGGGRTSVVFTYDTPWVVDDQGVAHLYWQKQPGTLADQIQVFWDSPNNGTLMASGALTSDREIDMAPDKVSIAPGKPAQAQLPSISL